MVDSRKSRVSAVVVALGSALVAGFALGALVGVPEGSGGRSLSGRGGDGEVQSRYVFRNPILDAKAGEWARFDLYGGEQQMVQKVTQVDSVTHRVTILRRTTQLPSGKLVGSEPHHYGPNHFLFGYAGIIEKIHPDEIVVAGRTFRCLCIEYRSLGGLVKTWYTPKVTCLGMLKQVIVSPRGQSRVNAVLVAWGRKWPTPTK